MAIAKNSTSRRTVRRQELVEAAVAVFSAKGVSAASVDDIVRAAGVAKGTFYLYFATKDDAVNAVAAAMVEGVAARIEAAATDASRSPVERLLAFGEGPSRRRRRAVRARAHRGLPPAGEPPAARPDRRAGARPAGPGGRGDHRRRDRGRASSARRTRDAPPRTSWPASASLHEVVCDPAGRARGRSTSSTQFVLRGLGYDGELRRDGSERSRGQDQRPDEALSRRRAGRRSGRPARRAVARSTPSSGSTARASRRRSGCCSG